MGGRWAKPWSALVRALRWVKPRPAWAVMPRWFLLSLWLSPHASQLVRAAPPPPSQPHVARTLMLLSARSLWCPLACVGSPSDMYAPCLIIISQ